MAYNILTMCNKVMKEGMSIILEKLAELVIILKVII